MMRSITFTAAVILVPTLCQAGKVKVWNHNSASHYDKAQLSQAVVSNEGALRLSRQLKPLAGLEAAHVWDLVEDKDGNLIVATGNEGKIYKLTPAGKVSVLFDSEDSQVLCLAAAPDGTIFAGTGPSGLIIRLGPDGNTRVLYDSPEQYVWSLALDAKGETIYAGTGPNGRIYKVTSDGQASVFYTTKQEHIHCLAMGTKHTLYAGTDKGGLVYRIDAKGKGFVLYNAPQSEVRSLLVTSEGVYAGTSSPGRKRGGGSGSSASSDRASDLALVSFSRTGEKGSKQGKDEPARTSTNSSSEKSKDSSEKAGDSENSGRSAPSSGENSLYRIDPDGTVREIFREKTLLLSLLRRAGRMYIGTGMEGQLFEVDEATKERSEVARLDHGQIQCMCRRKDGSIVLGTGDPGKLYVLQDKFAPSGAVVSEVLDAKIISKWGSLRWQADAPAGSNISLAVRTGNVAEPDETWSDWSAEETDAQQARVTAPTARFLQYRVTLKTEDADKTPVLRSLAIRYATTNQSPEVTDLDVPDLDAGNLENPKKLKFKWKASDPNDDDLTYNLYIRKDGWKSWVQIEEGLEKKEYEWDTTTTSSGVYRLKVAASDRKENAEEEALSGERISEPFVVAHQPPDVQVKFTGLEKGQPVVEAAVADSLVRLTSASFSLNGKKWVNVFPIAGLFDSKAAQFRFQTEALKPGTHVLVLKVTDAAGNTGSGDVVFTIK